MTAMRPLQPTPPRRWFSFTLRTLFVVVTVFGVWLGWNLNRIAHRKAVRATIEAHGGGIVRYRSASELAAKGEICGVALASAGLRKQPAIPVIRKWLGDESACHIVVRNRADAVMALKAFPECSEIEILSAAESSSF